MFGAAAVDLGGIDPQPLRDAGCDEHGLRFPDIKFTCAEIYTGGADHRCARTGLPVSGQKAGRADVFEEMYSQPVALFFHQRLHLCSAF